MKSEYTSHKLQLRISLLLIPSPFSAICTVTRPGKTPHLKKCMKPTDEILEVVARFHERGHFQKSLRDQIIESIEAGVPRSVIAYRYGISRSTLCDWMRNHSSDAYRSKQLGKHLSDIEKRSIIRSVEQGTITKHAARRAHGLSGNTLNRWLKESVAENVELEVYDPFAMEN